MPQTTKDYFKSEYNRNLAEAQAISDKIESEGRSPTSEEREQVKGLVSQAESFRQKFTALEEGENLRKSIEQMTGVFNTPAESAPEGAKSIGDAFVKSSAFQALTKGALSSGQWTTGAVDVGNFEDYEVGGKATVTTIASPVVQPGAVQVRTRFSPNVSMCATCWRRERPTPTRCRWSEKPQQPTLPPVSRKVLPSPNRR